MEQRQLDEAFAKILTESPFGKAIEIFLRQIMTSLIKDAVTNIVKEGISATSTSHSSYDPHKGRLDDTNHHDDQCNSHSSTLHSNNGDHDNNDDERNEYDTNDIHNDISGEETESDVEMGNADKRNTTQLIVIDDVAGTTSGPSNPSSTDPNSMTYNYPSNHEYPNGNVVETIRLLPSDQEFRAKSTGWALLTLQSFKAIVGKGCDVKTHVHNSTLKAQTNTYQTLYALKRKHNMDAYSINNDNRERVDIAEKICLGVYKCPMCDFSERPRMPKTGRNMHSRPRPSTTQCSTHKMALDWHRCSASAVIIYYHDRMKTEIHHVGFHNHLKPPLMRTDVLTWREKHTD
ncbi:hypothetical protein FBU30_009192 [Linnemannia zychae]|nr:hypothetical protein FBU30_009192 [Linnemannia zychae]